MSWAQCVHLRNTKRDDEFERSCGLCDSPMGPWICILLNLCQKEGFTGCCLNEVTHFIWVVVCVFPNEPPTILLKQVVWFVGCVFTQKTFELTHPRPRLKFRALSSLGWSAPQWLHVFVCWSGRASCLLFGADLVNGIGDIELLVYGGRIWWSLNCSGFNE